MKKKSDVEQLLDTRAKRKKYATDACVETRRERRRTSADRFGMPPMDLTESLAERCRVILCFIFESRARIGHGTLTALVVMLYNALPASIPRPSAALGAAG